MMRAIAGVLLLLLTSVAAACDGRVGPCAAAAESLQLTVEGDCAPERYQISVRNSACSVFVTPADATSLPAWLPAEGALDQNQDVLRQGGWQLYGDVQGRFMRCSTRRVAWYLEMVCLDGSGNVACTAHLRE